MSDSVSIPPGGLMPQQEITDIDFQSHQQVHRSRLISEWPISSGIKVLEIGCGQGDCTIALANLVGPEGHVDAVDPASLDYGAPETLGEAHARYSKTTIGSRITWHQASPVEFLASVQPGTYDVAVLCHSLWYFASPAEVSDTLSALKSKAAKLCIAEYSLSATEAGAVPHVLTALTRASLEAHKEVSTENIRTPLAPNAIKRLAETTGWGLTKETNIVPDEGLEDGRWETNTVASETFMKEIDGNIKEEKIKVVLGSMRQAVLSAIQGFGSRKVRTMDVWVAMFE